MYLLYKKTENYHIVQVQNDSYVLFNTMLNHPILIDKEALDWFNEHKTITKDDLDNFNDDTHAIFSEFVHSYLFLPENCSEHSLIAPRNEEHMLMFEKASWFDCLDLRVSEACNFGCPHCIAACTQNSSIMSIETAQKCIDEYISIKSQSEVNVNPINIHFGNSEPLINFPVIKSTVEYTLARYPHCEFKFSINTNLSLLTEEIARFLVNNNIQIYTSLDGPQKGNDAIRMYKDGTGTYNDIISKFDLLRSLGRPILGISITINEKNFKYFDDAFWDWCLDNNFVSIAADFDLINSISIPNDEKIAFLCSTWKKLTQRGVEFYGTWITPFIKLSNECAAKKAFAFCRASAGYNFSVDSQCNVYACSYSDTPMSTIKDFSTSIKRGGTYYNFVHSRLAGNIRKQKCKKCFLYGSCAGQCDRSVVSMDEETLETQCEFYRGVTEQMLIAQANLMEEV